MTKIAFSLPFLFLHCRSQLEGTFTEGVIQALPVLLRPSIEKSTSCKDTSNSDILNSAHLVTAAAGAAKEFPPPPPPNSSHIAAAVGDSGTNKNRTEAQLFDSVDFSKSQQACPTCQRAYPQHHQDQHYQKPDKKNLPNKPRKKSTTTSSSMSNKHKSDILKKIADELELGDYEDYHYHSDSDFDADADSDQLQAALAGLEKDSFGFEQTSNLEHATN